MLLKDYYNEDDEIGKTEIDENDVLKSMKIGSLFRVMFYNLHNGNKRTPLHTINAVEIYERCKNREFITSFNRSGSYVSMKKHRNDLAKFAITNSSEFGLPIPSHFSPSTFTISAFNNFHHVDKNTLSVKSGSHGTVNTLFEEIPTKKEMKLNIDEVNLAAVKTLSKLACQELVSFAMEKPLTLPEPFIVETETYNLNGKKNDNQLKKFLWSCLEQILTQLQSIYRHGLGHKPFYLSQNYHRSMLLFCHFSHIL